MTTSDARAVSQRVRDRAATALMLLATLGVLAAFAGSIGTASAASAENVVVELWRTYGFVVFAGLFMLRRGWRRERINTMGVAIRSGGPADIEPVVRVWQAANTARRDGLPMPPENEARVRAYLSRSDAFLLVADVSREVAGLALGMRDPTDDGDASPVSGVCYVPMVYVAPGCWGRGIGGRIVDAVLAEARRLGYGRIQLWTQTDNARAQRLYEGRGFIRTGREETDSELGERSLQYERAL